jgi:hypothetical protein
MLWRSGPVALLIGMVATLAAAQQLPPGVDPETGARPGNEIGTGSSLPLSDKASNITPQDTTSTIAPNLPSPAVGPDASVRNYLVAARSALLVGRTGEAQPLVDAIGQALHALAAGDRGHAVQTIETALSRPIGRCCQDLEITRKPRLRARGDSAGRSSGSNGV